MPATPKNNTAKVLTILQAAKVQNRPPKQDFTPWGGQADVAKQQGWYPETTYQGDTTYRSAYGLFNSAIIPGQKERGHIAVIAHPNNTMDIVLRDAASNVIQSLGKNLSPEAVQKYILNTVGNRVDMIQAGTNWDKDKGDYMTMTQK